MKTKILLVLLLAVSIISMASVTLDWGGRVYSLPGAQEIFKVSAVEDGVYAFGYTDEKGINEDMLILKFDLQGNLVYENSLGGIYNDWVNSGGVASDGDLVIIGTSGSYGSDFDIYFNKIGKKQI